MTCKHCGNETPRQPKLGLPYCGTQCRQGAVANILGTNRHADCAPVTAADYNMIASVTSFAEIQRVYEG